MRPFLPVAGLARNGRFDISPEQAFMQPNFIDYQGSSCIATPQSNSTISRGSSITPTIPFNGLGGWQGTGLSPLSAYEDFSSNYESYLSHGILPNHQMYEPVAPMHVPAQSDAWDYTLSATPLTYASIQTLAPSDAWLWTSFTDTSLNAHTPEFSDVFSHTSALSPLIMSDGTSSATSGQSSSPAPVARSSTKSFSSVGCKRRKAGSGRIHNDSDGNLICTECNKCLSKLWKESVRRHWRESCPQNPNREKHRSHCSECGDSFTRASSLKRHWMLKHGKLDYSYPGPKCTRA